MTEEVVCEGKGICKVIVTDGTSFTKTQGNGKFSLDINDEAKIVLDNIIYHSRSGYEEGYTDELIEWVDGLMEFIPKKANIYLAQHASQNGRYYSGKMVVNHEKMLEVLKGHFEDGQNKGMMEQVYELSPIHAAELKAKYAQTGKEPKDYRLTKKAIHFYAAKPSAGAKEITVIITSRFGKVWKETIQLGN